MLAPWMLICLGLAGAAPPRRGAAPPFGLPPLQLAESVPQGTGLDDPAIPDAATLWVARIDAARARLDISEFYLSPREDPGPERLSAVLEAIQRAGARGVQVRLLLDAKFDENNPGPGQAAAQWPGVTVRRLDLRPHTGGVQHAKYFLVDGEMAWLGSQNLDWRSLDHIHELGVELREPALINPLQAIFDMDWAMAAPGAEAPTPAGPPPTATFSPLPYGAQTVQAALVASPRGLLPPGVPWDLPLLISAIDGARERVQVQVMSYAVVGYDHQYWDTLDAALRRAAARGVQVQLLVGHWLDKPGKREALQSLDVMPQIDVRIVTIPEDAGGPIPYARVIHAKYMVVDGARSWLGTSNWSRDYFEGSRNVGVFVEGAPFAADLQRVHERLWNSPYAAPAWPPQG